MELVADLHIHSHFSRATSPNLTFEHLTRWAQLKGIHIVGTGDISHPGWLAEMREKLEPAEDGLYRLKAEYTNAVQAQVPPACHAPVRFMLGGEISNIYKRGDRTRKVHNIVFAPSFAALERLQARLEKIGNIRSDGRPILGLDSRDLLEIVLDTDSACHLIPAHIWTPWFSLLGSKSGFDSVAECYADLTPHIFALETGLSSDPPMNWRVSALDRYTLVSNSDAHSPEKLGREVTLFDTELAYPAVFHALRYGRGEAFPAQPAHTQSSLSVGMPVSSTSTGRNASPLLSTVEFFPEEGKYHFDGHRACGIVWDPPTTLAHGGVCPVCNKEVTIGVMHRVEALADRPEGFRPAASHPFHSLIPLPELLGEVCGVGASSKQVQAEYFKLLARLGSELNILRAAPLEEIAAAGGARLAEGIGRMRRGAVSARAGYDGEYGVIRVFGGASVSETQMGLFAGTEERRDADDAENADTFFSSGSFASSAPVRVDPRPVSDTDTATAALHDDVTPYTAPSLMHHASGITAGLNDQQRAAVLCIDAPLVIVAGPGTGKTRTLTVRIAHLILDNGVAPEAILAITFTNKAAGEMRGRLGGLLGEETAGRVSIKTFHAFGARLLREHAARLGLSPDFVILTDDDQVALLKLACPELKQAEVDDALAQISATKAVPGDIPRLKSGSDMPNPLKRIDEGADQPAPTGLASQVALDTAAQTGIYERYTTALRASNAVDFDDLIVLPIRLFEAHPDVLAAVQARYRWISVDEYQDVNQAQYHLLRLLTSGGANLCVIGDPDQAIYGFRGADRRYFLRFTQDYPGAVTLHLSHNYRSTQLILDAATQVITRNADRTTLKILSDFADEVRLDVYRAPTDKAEAEYVVHQIEQMVGGTSYFSLDSGRASGETPAVARSFADFAVLYRLSAQSRLLIEAFDRSGIPYQTVGQAPLTSHKAVREVLAHLWLLYNPRSQVHGAQAAGLPATQSSASSVTQAAGLPATQSSGLRYDLLPELAQAWQNGAPVARLIEQATEQIAARRRKPYADADARRLHQLTLRAVPFEDRLADFLEATVLQSETDAYDPRADRVALMTLHASKGLEFPVVFIVGCEEGLLPYERVARSEIAHSEATDIEEERRLFYVGLTRAQRKLVLTHARTRFLYGQRKENPISRFVKDIEDALKEMQEMRRRPERKPESTQLSLF
ncbi:MAG: UvrD-helicase domain-containing protein [Anaerolineae bacterium]|nr:UvrD-helicase domain-containing protein [Anaerolineae bacterium]